MSNKTLVINLCRDTALQVDTRAADGTLDTVQVQPRGRVELEIGTVVDPRYLSINGKSLRVVPPDTAPDAPQDGGNV